MLSLPLLLLIWQVLSMVFVHRLFPSPITVSVELWDQLTRGPLIADLAKTLYRALTAFLIAMALGTAIGIALGRNKFADALFSPWVVVGLNMPAIVVAIVLYLSLGLKEHALILAVIINKIPLVITNVREGVRSFSRDYDELARAYRMSFWRRLRLIFVPQLMPFVMASARTGLSLVWKIVLVFEVLGSDGGVGFRVGIFFQRFDMAGLLSYTTAFIMVVLVLEYGVMRPLERRILRWRAERT